jgi:hypothetical protein
MKKFALLFILGAAALPSFAQTAPADSMVTISGAKSGMKEQVRAMPADEFNQFTGSYELANGDSLALFTRGQKKYAALHGDAWHEIVATSANSFVAKDSRLKLDIYREDDGSVHGDVYLPKNDTQTADGRSGEQFAKVGFH